MNGIGLAGNSVGKIRYCGRSCVGSRYEDVTSLKRWRCFIIRELKGSRSSRLTAQFDEFPVLAFHQADHIAFLGFPGRGDQVEFTAFVNLYPLVHASAFQGNDTSDLGILNVGNCQKGRIAGRHDRGMGAGRWLGVLVSFHEIGSRAVVLVAEDHLPGIVHIFLFSVFESDGISPHGLFPVTPYLQRPVLLLDVEPGHFAALVLEQVYVTLHSPEDAVVVVSVGNRYELHGRILLHKHDTRLIVLVLAIVHLIVFMVPHDHV